MRRVRQVGTRAELIVRAWLRRHGLAYRIAPRTLPGRPDLANCRQGWALFVHGCFWHAHDGCRRATVPKRNRAFWQAKLDGNRRRDRAKARALEALGLRVLVVWECEALALAERGTAPPALQALLAGPSNLP
ncbi:MAG: DNA mismatch endonuclease Vsr [Geminicoccaceae bacterium]|nr:MAG: DNA mismatch endonuclease Vsr [Geminicoccaceae bacterium]